MERVNSTTTAERLAEIADRLDELRRLDTGLALFGAAKHEYRLGPVASEDAVAAFETRYGIRLPAGYRAFITQVGNGGAGPWYGLVPLEKGVLDDLDFERGDIDPSTPFPHREAWNLSPDDPESDPETDSGYEADDAYSAFHDEYFDPKWVSGLVRISNYGCGITLNLVVNGDEYGNVWVDDRGNDGGIYPDPFFDREKRTDFLTWYETWLGRSLRELKEEPKSSVAAGPARSSSWQRLWRGIGRILRNRQNDGSGALRT